MLTRPLDEQLADRSEGLTFLKHTAVKAKAKAIYVAELNLFLVFVGGCLATMTDDAVDCSLASDITLR